MSTIELPCWPNLFVVGVHRGGTTTLWSYLNQHPDIFMSQVKEPHFFSPLWQAGKFSPLAPLLTPAIKDEAAYLRLFSGAQQKLRGEASVSYFWEPSSATAIKSVSPNAKIVVSLRDPVERAYSHYFQAIGFGVEHRTFREAVQAELAGMVPDGLEPYVARGNYSEDLSRYLDAFGQQVHVMYLEDISRNRQAELVGLFEFLDVDPTAASHIDPQVLNPSSSVPRGRLGRQLLNSPRARVLARRVVPTSLRPRLEVMLSRQMGKPPMEAEIRSQLRRFYESDRQRLLDRLDRRLPSPRAKD